MGVKVREMKKGEWWIFIYHHGKHKAKKIGRDKRVALEVAKKIEAKLALGEMDLEKMKKRVPTFKQFVYGWEDHEGMHPGWLHSLAELSFKNSTRTGYKNILSRHLIPTFGNNPLNEINSRLVSDFTYRLFNAKLRSGSVKNIKNCLSSILRKGTQDGYLESNPARGVSVPRPEGERSFREPCPFTWEERDHFESTFKEKFPRYYPLVVCGFRTGLRIGELLGLQWGDIDFFNKLILVQRNITLGKITTTKTLSSKRMVRMTTNLVEILEKHRQRIIEEKLRKGWKEMPEWVFVNQIGSFVNYGRFVNHYWHRIITLSGLSRRTPHDMRHTYATLRLSKGDSLAEVSKEMGHGNTDLTYKTYYKWLPKESRTNIDELDKIFRPILYLADTVKNRY
jgi:integrase